MKEPKGQMTLRVNVSDCAPILEDKRHRANRPTKQKLGNSQQNHWIRPWIKSIVNHTYWVAASSGNNGQMKTDKWKSLSNHLINVHDHDSEVFPRCEHGQLEEPRDWMQQGSRCHKMVKDVVESPYLLRDLPKLSPVYQTYGLEVFHSVVNHFAPKSTHFFYMPMHARLCIAAFHYNENGTRRQSLTREGELQWSVSYPKAKKGQECVVKPRRVSATFGK
ncbi:uncharacterized protein LOC133198376 [Saccostrea echinata]|uniref:uncharacterized protein LOC133198376 n=1 Tax=Saccostrea echinata TaxID=191078 RepID=UPI002A7F7293|nr:uncharacterized protein LOC133198376 [Saccostrea echinata]